MGQGGSVQGAVEEVAVAGGGTAQAGQPQELAGAHQVIPGRVGDAGQPGDIDAVGPGRGGQGHRQGMHYELLGNGVGQEFAAKLFGLGQGEAPLDKEEAGDFAGGQLGQAQLMGGGHQLLSGFVSSPRPGGNLYAVARPGIWSKRGRYFFRQSDTSHTFPPRKRAAEAATG